MMIITFIPAVKADTRTNARTHSGTHFHFLGKTARSFSNANIKINTIGGLTFGHSFDFYKLHMDSGWKKSQINNSINNTNNRTTHPIPGSPRSEKSSTPLFLIFWTFFFLDETACRMNDKSLRRWWWSRFFFRCSASLSSRSDLK